MSLLNWEVIEEAASFQFFFLCVAGLVSTSRLYWTCQSQAPVTEGKGPLIAFPLAIH